MQGTNPGRFSGQARSQIVLDTNVVRDLGYPAGEEIARTLSDAASVGHRIHLAEHAFIELTAQLDEGRLAWSVWVTARDRIRRVLDADQPVLLGGWELCATLGLPTPRHSDSADPLDVLRRHRAEIRAFWEHISGARNPTEFRQSWVEGSARLWLKRGAAAETLDQLRGDWTDFFDELVEKAGSTSPPNAEALAEIVARSVDRDLPVDPPLSARIDTSIRVFAHLSSRRLAPRGAYNPHGKRRRNDGIDYDMLVYLVIPAIVCTSDGNFKTIVRESGSQEADWVMTPADLKEALTSGSSPVLWRQGSS